MNVIENERDLDISSDLFSSYIFYSLAGLQNISTSNIIKALKCLKFLSFHDPYRVGYELKKGSQIEKLIKLDYWEINATLLIIAGELLLLLNLDKNKTSQNASNENSKDE